MIESIAVTLAPVLFLVVLFGGGALFRRKKINMDGDAPINRTLFYLSKYSILILWGAMALQSWDFNISLVPVPAAVHWISLISWFFGFALLFLGRFKLGNSFRLGTPKEGTTLTVRGLYRFSRNPMYVGFNCFTLSSMLYTSNPFVDIAGIYSIVIYHFIIRGEEKFLLERFGAAYIEYKSRVRRYL